ncbi:MAG: O-antigen ligase family protein [Bacteroidota bacterium]|nr:O-antigen ligase family protein [Bacteroidota bacterium]
MIGSPYTTFRAYRLPRTHGRSSPFLGPFTLDDPTVPITRLWMVRIIVFHAVLGIALKYIPYLSLLYALVVGWYALSTAIRTPTADRILYTIGYIAGAEVLIRMTKAPVLWMYSEYLILVLAIVLINRMRPVRRQLMSPLVYFLLLLPSVAVSALSGDWSAFRQGVAFNLAGPVCLGIGVLAVSRLSFSRRTYEGAMFFAALPVVSVAAIVAVRHLGGTEVHYAVSAASKEASGGYAPNQVSNALSFGAVMFLSLAAIAEKWKAGRTMMIVLFILLTVLAVLTMSRGGAWNLAAFCIPFFLFRLGKAKKRFRFLLGSAMVLLLYGEFIVPWMDKYSEGALERRYKDTNVTHRDEMARSELRAFTESPLTGVGPGMSAKYRREVLRGEYSESHTEFTRLLAEHGVFGIAAFLALVYLFAVITIRARKTIDRGWILGAILWVVVFFSHSATRLVIFAFLIMLATILSSIEDREMASP